VTTCPYAHDDGAYVLGALSPGERSAFEKHLAGCAECREAVAEIAVLPGLLGRLPAEGVATIATPGEPEARVPALLEAVRASRARERSVRRRRYAGAGLAAAVLALLVGVGVVAAWPNDGGTGDPPTAGSTPSSAAVRMMPMKPIVEKVPVDAEIGLHSMQWGTEVTMHCTYPASNAKRPYTFRLLAHGADGSTEQVGSWLAGPGDDVTVTGSTRFTGADLVRLEIIRYDGRPLLAYDVP
jgi:predicted anti-sigma-YlaC factor YlaD